MPTTATATWLGRGSMALLGSRDCRRSRASRTIFNGRPTCTTTPASSRKTQVATQLATENNAPVASEFLETDYGYNWSAARTRSPTERMITWTVFDAAGDVLSTWVGTDAAGATEMRPSSLDSGVRNPLNNMVETGSCQYDPDGDVLQSTAYVDANP